MKILIVGGTQFIGRHLSIALMKAGNDVVLFHKNRNIQSEFLSFEHILGDRRMPLETKIAGKFDLVIDTCAYKPSDLAFLTSINFKKYLLVSTVAVYRPDIPEGEMENAEKISLGILGNAVNNYGLHKRITEDLVVERYPNSIILRPSVVVGPKDNSKRFETIFEKHIQSNILCAPFSLDNSLVTQFIDVRDLVELTLEIVSKDLTGPFNLVGKTTTWNNFLSIFADAIGVDLINRNCDFFPLWDTTRSRGLRTLQSSYDFICEFNFTSLYDSIKDWFGEYQKSVVESSN